jgi:two-component system, OmpR family, phosphate regulon sensor histidine kinase PhoR
VVLSLADTGPGLAIVKHIVSRHRGQLRIESTVSVGTTVSIWLPAA